jgi:predicted thioesterase
LEGEVRLVVSENDTARHLGSGGVKVLATPQMVLLMERAAVAAVDPLLPEVCAMGTASISGMAPTRGF